MHPETNYRTFISGDRVHGEASSANATSGVALSLFEAGSVTAATVGANDKLHIVSMLVIAVPAGRCVLAAAADTAGRRIAGGTLVANSGFALKFPMPFVCPAGVTPKIFCASAGQVDVSIEGFIERG